MAEKNPISFSKCNGDGINPRTSGQAADLVKAVSSEEDSTVNGKGSKRPKRDLTSMLYDRSEKLAKKNKSKKRRERQQPDAVHSSAEDTLGGSDNGKVETLVSIPEVGHVAADRVTVTTPTPTDQGSSNGLMDLTSQRVGKPNFAKLFSKKGNKKVPVKAQEPARDFKKIQEEVPVPAANGGDDQVGIATLSTLEISSTDQVTPEAPAVIKFNAQLPPCDDKTPEAPRTSLKDVTKTPVSDGSSTETPVTGNGSTEQEVTHQAVTKTPSSDERVSKIPSCAKTSTSRTPGIENGRTESELSPQAMTKAPVLQAKSITSGENGVSKIPACDKVSTKTPVKCRSTSKAPVAENGHTEPEISPQPIEKTPADDQKMTKTPLSGRSTSKAPVTENGHTEPEVSPQVITKTPTVEEGASKIPARAKSRTPVSDEVATKIPSRRKSTNKTPTGDKTLTKIPAREKSITKTPTCDDEATKAPGSDKSIRRVPPRLKSILKVPEVEITKTKTEGISNENNGTPPGDDTLNKKKAEVDCEAVTKAPEATKNPVSDEKTNGAPEMNDIPLPFDIPKSDKAPISDTCPNLNQPKSTVVDKGGLKAEVTLLPILEPKVQLGSLPNCNGHHPSNVKEDSPRGLHPKSRVTNGLKKANKSPRVTSSPPPPQQQQAGLCSELFKRLELSREEDLRSVETLQSLSQQVAHIRSHIRSGLAYRAPKEVLAGAD